MFVPLRPDPFFNRTQELAALERAFRHRGHGGQMALLYGRRRLGKTYLLQRYFTGGLTGEEPAKDHCYFLAEQTTGLAQREALAEELLRALPTEGVTVDELAVSWNALLRWVSQQCRERGPNAERFALILDEFSYLVQQTPELPSIIQAWWDREGIHSSLFLILCGSQLSVMASLGSESAPLFGRFNAGIMCLDPLRYEDVASFYQNALAYTPVDMLMMYGILGGTPRYHALVDTTRPLSAEVVALLLAPRAPLENEVRFLLSSEQIRDPAPYNAVLAAIAGGETQYGRIQQRIDIDRNTLAFYLTTLQDLGWVRREYPYGETTARRALYQIADPFLAFWYRFVQPLASALQFTDPAQLYADRIEPYLADYMGRHVFEEICAQWLKRHARMMLGLSLNNLGRYWSRDGQIELDLMGQLESETYLYGECKWSANSPVGLSVYSRLQAKVAALPDVQWRDTPSYLLFSVGGFSPEILSLAADPQERLSLITGADLLPMFPFA